MPEPSDTKRDSASLAKIGGEALHGGDVWGASRLLGMPLEDILDLSASLNPLGPPPGLTEAVCQAMGRICHYPDRTNRELRSALAGELDLEPANILPGNGSTSLIRLLALVMDLRNIVILAPAFGEFGRAFAAAGRHFHYYRPGKANTLAPGKDDLEKIWDMDPSCIIVTNPVSPSGELLDMEFLEALVERARRQRIWVILDEAFIDFAPAEARGFSPPLVESHPRLVVLRSMTKFYCLAGLRLGYLLADHASVADMAPQGVPWSVNTLAQMAGVYCLGQKEYEKQTRTMVRQWRGRLAEALQGLGLSCMPSQANYLLCTLPEGGPSAAQVAQRLLPKGILVRDASNFTGCNARHMRLAVCTPDDQDRLLAELPAALQ